jgi:hypothetical protein
MRTTSTPTTGPASWATPLFSGPSSITPRGTPTSSSGGSPRPIAGDRPGLAPGGDLVAVEYDVKALAGPVTIHGYETEVTETPGSWPQLKKTDRKHVYTVPYFAEYVPKRSVRLPFAYLLPSPDAEVTCLLLQHGIVVEALAASATLEVETFLPKEPGDERLYGAIA